MTREEELDWLYRLRSEIYVYMPKEWLIPMNEALDMAIKALEQEPSGDLISRQAVLDELNKWEWQELYLPIHFKENIIDVVPSVNPQEPKTGHWIDMDEGFSPCECSECGSVEFIKSKYCPNCGCRMIEPQESEEVQ